VSLERAIPFVGNSFKPLFVGKFHRVDGIIMLSGRFTMPWWVKVFMTFWFGSVSSQFGNRWLMIHVGYRLLRLECLPQELLLSGFANGSHEGTFRGCRA